MTPRCADCHNRLTHDEVFYYGQTCEACERRLMRRLDDQYRAQPSKFARRLAVMMAMAIIFACIAVVKRLGGG